MGAENFHFAHKFLLISPTFLFYAVLFVRQSKIRLYSIGGGTSVARYC